MPGELNKARDKSYIIEERRKAFGKFSSQNKPDTKEDPHNNHTIEDQGQSWDFDPD